MVKLPLSVQDVVHRHQVVLQQTRVQSRGDNDVKVQVMMSLTQTGMSPTQM